MSRLTEMYPELFEDPSSGERRATRGGVPINPNSEAAALLRALAALKNSPNEEITYFHDDIVTFLRTEISQLIPAENTPEIILTFSYQIATLLLQVLPEYTTRKRMVQEYGKKLISFLLNLLSANDFAQVQEQIQNILQERKLTSVSEALLFLHGIGDPALYEWLNRSSEDPTKPLTIMQSIEGICSLSQFSETNIYPFLDHPHRNRVIKKIGVLDFIRIMSANYVEGRGERLRSGVSSCSFSLSFLLDNPRFFFLVHETPYIDAHVLARESWEKKLLKLYRVQHTLDTNGLTDEEVLWAGERVWQPQPDDIKEIKRKQRYSSSPEFAQRRAMARVKRGEGYDFAYEQKLRRFLKKEKGLPPDRILISEDIHTILEQCKVLEHPHHPIVSFIPLTGFEIESGLIPGMDRAVYGIMAKIGFTMGLDLVEFSPGPFPHWKIAQAVFRSWLDGGFLDIHREVVPGAHFNIETKSLYLATKFTRLMHATAYAYIERFEDPETGYVTPRIYRKKSSFGPYTEIKDFRLLTQKDFCHFLYEGAMIASCMMAYEAIFCEKHKLSSSKFNEKVDDLYHKVELSDSDIKSSALGPEQIKLAMIWQKLCNDFSNGMRQIGLDKVISAEAPIEKARKFYSAIEEVFPQVWDHYKPDRVNISFDSTPKVNMGEQQFPNIVTFARHLTQQAVNDVEEVFSHAEQVVQLVLTRMATTPQGNTLDNQVKKFLKRFNCGYTSTEIEIMSMDDKHALIKEIMELYKIT